MNTLRQYQKRFNQLMESKSGDVKPLIMEQPTEDTTNQLTAEQEAWLDYVCSGNQDGRLILGSSDEFVSTWTVDNQGFVTVIGDFDCSNGNLKDFKGVKFAKVTGYFDCGRNNLTSLEGAPQEVGGYFNCEKNKLTSLEGAPKKVGDEFDCTNNRLTSLKGAPQQVGGYFWCGGNMITSLEGAPQKVDGNFRCDGNDVTSLEGAPQEVGGDFGYPSNLGTPEDIEKILDSQNSEVRGKIIPVGAGGMNTD